MSEVKTHTAKDMYRFFCEKYPDTDVTYALYKYTISEFNKRVANRALAGEEISLGKGMGSICIDKITRNFKKKVVDFGETRKLKARGIDKVVYFTNDFYFKWTWHKKSSKVTNKSAYSFKASAGENGLKKRLARLLRDDEFAHLNYKSNAV